MEGALDWLLPRSVDPLRTVRGEGVAAQLAQRDGLVTELWPGLLVARDQPEGPAERLAAVAGLVPPGAVLARRSALWVHTGRYRPSRLDVVLAGRRHRSTAMVQVHLERTSDADVVPLPKGRVTSPARTAVDIARREPARQAVTWLAALHAGSDLRGDDVVRALERAGGLPGVTRARQLLAPVTQPAPPAP
jgi:hypothetical protein